MAGGCKCVELVKAGGSVNGSGGSGAGGDRARAGLVVPCTVFFLWRTPPLGQGLGAAHRHLRSSQPQGGGPRVLSSLQKEVCVTSTRYEKRTALPLGMVQADTT